jgi:hypothetical protein
MPGRFWGEVKYRDPLWVSVKEAGRCVAGSVAVLVSYCVWELQLKFSVRSRNVITGWKYHTGPMQYHITHLFSPYTHTSFTHTRRIYFSLFHTPFTHSRHRVTHNSSLNSTLLSYHLTRLTYLPPTPHPFHTRHHMTIHIYFLSTAPLPHMYGHTKLTYLHFIPHPFYTQSIKSPTSLPPISHLCDSYIPHSFHRHLPTSSTSLPSTTHIYHTHHTRSLPFPPLVPHLFHKHQMHFRYTHVHMNSV